MSQSPVPPGATAVCLRPEYSDYSPEKLAVYAGIAEANGFHSVWVAESWGLDAVALLSSIGANTRRIGLGTAIVNVFSRSPALLAMTAVTLNDLYGGRFILGLGTSTRALVEGWHGMSFTRPVTRLRDTVNIVRRAASGEEVNYEGAAASLKGYRLRVKPRSAPPPIYLAALGEESMRVVAEIGDGWMPYLLPLRGMRESVDSLRRAQRAAGRPENAVCVAPLVLTAVSEDAGEARRAAREHIAFYLGAMGPHYRGFVARFGFAAEVEQVRATWATGEHDEARAAVTESMVDELAVAGTPEQCRSQLARVRDAGADLPILFFPGSCSNRMVELALDTMTTTASNPPQGRA